MKKNLFLTLLISIAMFLGFNVANAETNENPVSTMAVCTKLTEKYNEYDTKCLIKVTLEEGEELEDDTTINFVITEFVGYNQENPSALIEGYNSTINDYIKNGKIEDVSTIDPEKGTDFKFSLTYFNTGDASANGSVAYVYFDDDDELTDGEPCGVKYSIDNSTPNTPTTPGTGEENTPEGEEENNPTGGSSTNTPSTTPSTDENETEEGKKPNASTSTSTDENKCDIKDGKYYGPNGELLKDKAAYDKVCGSKNYKDGYGNPYVLLGFGIALIAGVITVNKKNKLFN